MILINKHLKTLKVNPYTAAEFTNGDIEYLINDEGFNISRTTPLTGRIYDTVLFTKYNIYNLSELYPNIPIYKAYQRLLFDYPQLHDIYSELFSKKNGVVKNDTNKKTFKDIIHLVPDE